MMDPENVHERELGGQLLASVSRSFYLTLKALPRQVREPISLAYLLARTADTMADTAQISASVRLSCLQQFRALIFGEEADEAALAKDLNQSFLPHQTDAAEAALLKRFSEALQWQRSVTGKPAAAIRKVLGHIICGQALDIERFPGEGQLRSLQTAAELEEYTWLVAGCVGEFWTEICLSEIPGAFDQGVSSAELHQLGAAYGKGLQLVNVLRDIGKDAAMGRCYLPSEEWVAHGLSTAAIEAEPSCLKPVWECWSARCQELLRDGVTYATKLQDSKLRYASALPVLLGIRTLTQMRSATPEQLQAGVKISRVDVAKTLLQATLSNSKSGIARLAEKFGLPG